MTDELERCLAAGMDGLLTKPLEPMRLGETLERHGLGTASGGARAAAPARLRSVMPVIDLAHLRAIVGNDDEFVQQLCQTFLASSAKIVEELRRALSEGDRELLAAMAHKLKGGSNSVCAGRVGELAAQLERNARTGPVRELGDSVEQIDSALAHCA